MAPATPSAIETLFQPAQGGRARALLVAGACGNVGFGKLGQFARQLAPRGVRVIALDPSAGVHEIPARLRKAYGDRFSAEEVEKILAGVTLVRGGVEDLPADVSLGFVFEAIPERLPLKHAFYRALRARDPDAFIFSATSGFPSTTLFDGLDNSERCGVLHPFFPHLTNKLWEMPTRGAVTGTGERKVVRGFLGSLGMNLIEVSDVPAFAADRLFCGMMLEAVRASADLGLSPAAIDDACKRVLGTSPFFVHNMIPGANYLSAHCMELMRTEVDSTLFDIPEVWRPYIEDPNLQWPYERGQTCPPDAFPAVRERMLGMLISLGAYMVEHEVATLPAINFLCENALGFREGVPALIAGMGLANAREVAATFLRERQITLADTAAPLTAVAPECAAWDEIYVGTSVHEGVGLISLRRSSLSDLFLRELGGALDKLQARDDVAAIVIAPDGVYSREFGHGADLQAFVPVLGNYEAAHSLIAGWKQVLARLRGGKPTVAALVGRVLGGSLELGSWCHARIAGEPTTLAFPETTVGVIPGLGGCHHLHRATPERAWPEIDRALLTGERCTAKQAHSWGFVSEIVKVSALPAASMQLARDLAAGNVPIPAFRETPAPHTVDRDAPITNAAGTVLDAKLRALLADTIEQANAATFAAGSAIEEQAAARSLTLSSSAIGVKAMLRGKPPVFEHPLTTRS